MLSNWEVEQLKGLLATYDSRSTWATVAVFAGLVVEYTVLLWLKWHEMSRLEKALTIAAGFAITAGVFGEYWYTSDAMQVSAKLEDNSEFRARIARAQAAEANENAALAERDAAEANKSAESERLARAKLQAAIAPRSLSKDDQSHIGDACRPFAKQKIPVVVRTTVDSQLGFQIFMALKSGGCAADIQFSDAVRSEISFGAPLAPIEYGLALHAIEKALANTKKIVNLGFDGVLLPGSPVVISVGPRMMGPLPE